MAIVISLLIDKILMFSFYDSARSVKWDLLAQDKQKDVNNMHFPLTAKLLQINDYQQYCE